MMKKIVLKKLVENKIERTEIVLAAKSITDDLQGIIEKLAKMEANNILPISDNMTELFGQSVTDNFNKVSVEALRTAIDSVRTAREEIAKVVERLENAVDGNISDMDLGDEDDQPEAVESPEPEEDDITPPENTPEPSEPDEGGLADLLSGSDSSDDSPLGRVKKESVENNAKILRESANPDRLIYFAYKKVFENSQHKENSCKAIAEAFGIDESDVKEIIEGNTWKDSKGNDSKKYRINDRKKSQYNKKSDRNNRFSGNDDELEEGKTFKYNDDEDDYFEKKKSHKQLKQEKKQKKKSHEEMFEEEMNEAFGWWGNQDETTHPKSAPVSTAKPLTVRFSWYSSGTQRDRLTIEKFGFNEIRQKPEWKVIERHIINKVDEVRPFIKEWSNKKSREGYKIFTKGTFIDAPIRESVEILGEEDSKKKLKDKN